MTGHDVTLPDGRTLHVWEHGDPDGPVVVVHHGTPGSGKEYTTDGPTGRSAVQRGLRLLSADRAGYGASSRHRGRSIADVAADTAALADALGVDRFHTWGISGGGPHALATAALLGDRVISAACLAGVAPYDAEGLDFLAGMGADNLEEFGLSLQGEAALRPFLQEGAQALAGSDVEDMITGIGSLLPPPDRDALRGEIGAELLVGNREAVRVGVDGWLDDDLAFTRPWGFDPAAIRCPLLLWQGDQDLMVPASHGHWLAEHVPHTEAWFDADQGHLSLLLHTDRVHEWLTSHA